MNYRTSKSLSPLEEYKSKADCNFGWILSPWALEILFGEAG
jgi:hypothetical protein